VFREGGRAWCAMAYVRLPDGRNVRVRGRGETAEAAVFAQRAAAERLQAANPAAEDLTVEQLAERWIDARSPGWKPSTLASYTAALKHVLPELGSARAARVGSLDAQRVVTRTLKRGVAVANRVRRVMHAMFAQAKRWGVITVNPVAGLEPIRRPAEDRGWWTPEQAEAFLTAAASSPYRDLFHAAITTGLRSGELLALRWRDAEDGVFTVRRSYSQHAQGRVQEPKTRRAARRVPVPASLWERLEARRRGADELVFASRRGTMLNPVNVRRALVRLAGVAGVPVIRFHDLRRTYASLLAARGYHPSVIQKLLGHSNPDLALRVYTSVSDALSESVVVDVGSNAGSNRDGQLDSAHADSSPEGVPGGPLDTLN
jgi:integrase